MLPRCGGLCGDERPTSGGTERRRGATGGRAARAYDQQSRRAGCAVIRGCAVNANAAGSSRVGVRIRACTRSVAVASGGRALEPGTGQSTAGCDSAEHADGPVSGCSASAVGHAEAAGWRR